jgi:hypothetical protein
MTMFVSAYKKLIGENKQESHQTPCLFSQILAYVLSRFISTKSEKRKTRKHSLIL